MPRYKVVPFMASIKEGQSDKMAAQQLEEVINNETQLGWKLFQVANVNMEIRPGCLNIFGSSNYVVYNQVIFVRED